MRHKLLTLLAVPLLLAPVRFQQGAGDITLTPSQATPGPRGTPAVALPSPTVVGPVLIDVSPSRAPMPVLPSPTATSFPIPAPTTVASPSEPPAPPTVTAPGPAMPGTQATLCVRALGLVNDLAVVSMQQSGQENLVDLTIAAAIAQVQAARAELKQALGYATSFCQNPASASQGGAELARPR
jgi:hypothetical protein